MANGNVQDRLGRIASRELVQLAASIAEFRVTRSEFASAANVSGIRNKLMTFSARHDSLTLFATDNRYGYLRPQGAWTGDDRTAVAACRRVLRAARIPPREIDRIDAVSEMGQVAERLGEGEVRVHEPTVLRKIARATRVVNGVPVWSSYAAVGLTRNGRLGRLELHWPEVPSVVRKEAERLQVFVKRGFEPPALAAARPESIEAGIIHSPAIGFFMDVLPVVRIIYRGDDPTIGRKPTLYVDRHGERVVMPRDIRPAEPPAGERKRPK